MKNKYYISNCNKTLQLLVTADSPITAICEAFSYMGFKQADDIPDDTLFPDGFIYVDERGFRTNIPQLYSVIDTNGHISNDSMAKWKIVSLVAIDRYDYMLRTFDPFCEYGSDSNE